MGTDCDHIGRHRRAVDPTDVVATVARRCDDDDPGVPGTLDGRREWITLVRRHARHAEREVEYTDVEPVVVPVLDDPVDAGDHLGDVGLARCAGDLDVDDPAVRGDAADHVAVVTGDDAGEVGAVAVGVEPGEIVEAAFVREVGPVDDLAGLVEPVDRSDAGVDQGDVDALPGRVLARILGLRLLRDHLHDHGLTRPDSHRQRDRLGVGGGRCSRGGVRARSRDHRANRQQCGDRCQKTAPPAQFGSSKNGHCWFPACSSYTVITTD